MAAFRLSKILGTINPEAVATTQEMPLPNGPDPNGKMEYSVVYTDRALNHMSGKFQNTTKYISQTLKKVYNADHCALVNGSGTSGMESVARQFGTKQKCLVIRNGFFSYRWTQIFEQGSIPSQEIVLKARPVEKGPNPMYAPVPVEEAVATIRKEKPGAVFAPHVETSSGMILPDDYIKAIAAATHEVGGIFVLDIIAGGCLWPDMKALGIDVLVGAPQKAWSGQSGFGYVMMSNAAHKAAVESKNGSTSFCLDLKKWITLMETYEKGGHMYHATQPTDTINNFADVIKEGEQYGFEKLKQEQAAIGVAVREFLAKKNVKSVAAPGFQAPTVVVSYTNDDGVKSGAKFGAQGMQIAAGVPLMVDDFTQSADYKSFRLGLFGYDKLHNIPRTVRLFENVFNQIFK